MKTGILLGLLVFTVVYSGIQGIPQAVAEDAWCNTSICDTNWGFRKSITIDKDKVGNDNNAGTLSNHPILISFTGTDFTDVEDETQSAGQDIRFTNQAGTDLDYEIEEYNETTNAMYIWVEVDSLSKSVDTIIYMYYGNSGASAVTNSDNTWNSNYKGVWHLNQASGGAGTILDSTSNNNDGTQTDNPTFGSTGKISKAMDFDGTDDNVDTGSTELKTVDALTIEAWFKTDSVITEEHHIIWQGQSGEDGYGTTPEIHITIGCNSFCPIGTDLTSLNFYLGPNGLGPNSAGSIIISDATFSDTTSFHHVVGTITNLGAGTPLGTLYLDGASIGTDTAQSTGTDRNLWNTNLIIGDAGGTIREFDGIIDEVRISGEAKDIDYVKTVFNSEDSPSTFYAVGTETTTIFPSGGSSIGDKTGSTSAPSFTKFLAPNEFPLSIQDTNYAYDDFSTKKTSTLNVGEPIQIKVLASDDGGGSDIKRISLYMNLHGSNRELYQSNTAVSYNNYGDPTIRNSEGIFDTVNVSGAANGLKQLVTFDIIFAKEMPLSDVILQVVDEVNNSVQLRASEAIHVIKADIIEESSQVEQTEIIESIPDKVPEWIKQRTTAWVTDSTTSVGFAQGLTGMINENILQIPDSRITAKDNSEISFQVPPWVKNNAKWWVEDTISETEFVNAIQFLIDNNHITIIS